MPEHPTSVLLIEHNSNDACLIQEILHNATSAPFAPFAPFALTHVDCLEDALHQVRLAQFDIILMNLVLPDSTGVETFTRVQNQAPDVPIVVLSERTDETLAINVVQMQDGAEDYLVKDDLHHGQNLCALLVSRSLRYAIERHRMQSELTQYVHDTQRKEARLHTLIERNADGIVIVDRDGTVQFVNPAAVMMFDRPAPDILHESFGFPVIAGETTELDVIRRDGKTVIVEMRVVETEWEGNLAYLASFRDITERKHAEVRQMMRFDVTSVLAQSETLFEAIPRLLQAVCERARWDMGEMWLVDAESRRLRWSGFWHIPSPSLNRESLERASRTLSLVAGEGVAGQVWQQHQPSSLVEITPDTTLSRTALLRDNGLQSAFAFPIHTGQHVTGVVVCYSHTTSQPADDLFKVLADIGSQIGQFLARKRAEEELRSAHRALRTLNECNQSLVHATDEDAFLHDICRIIVEVGGYRLAWAGFVEHDESKRVRIVSRAGYEAGFIEQIDIAWGNTDKGQGIIARAIRTGQPSVAKNILNDNTYAPMHAQATHCGFASSVVLPLAFGAESFGLLAIYAEEPDAFGKEEVRLLLEMANDLAYGIIALRTRAERDRAEIALRLYTERLKNMREIDQAILSAQTPEAIAHAALSHIQRLVPYQWAGIVEFDADADQHVVLVSDTKYTEPHALQDPDINQRIPTHMPDLSHGIQYGSARYLANLHELPNRSPVVTNLLDIGVQSCIHAPLIADGQYIGEINLLSTVPHAFTRQHLGIAREVADQMAVAIHHARLFEQVRAGRERLQKLSRRLMEVQEVERNHIARELHDEIGQSLTAIKISLQAVQRVPDATTLVSRLNESITIVDHALEQVRNLSLDLRPSLLDDLGLVAALRWYVDRQAQWGGFVAEFVSDSLVSRLPPDLETACFRVVQEALTNIVRHARAQRVRVELRQQNNELHLVIRDDGVGFDVRAAQERAVRGSSMGLLGMQERVLFANGVFEIDSLPTRGTEIRARFPIVEPQPAAMSVLSE